MKQTANYLMSQKTLCALFDWYSEILDSSARYTVFVSQRCYSLAVLLESLTGRQMRDTKDKVFLTDSAGLLRTNEAYHEYRTHGRVPDVLLVDDVLMHGHNINDFLKTVRDRLCQLAANDSALEKEALTKKIEKEMLRNVKISVFYSTDAPLLLDEAFWPALREHTRTGGKELIRVSNDISILLAYGAAICPPYLFSRKISAENFETVRDRLVDYEKTEYRSGTEFTKTAYITDPAGRILAYSTLRLVRNNVDRSVRVIPFLFLPHMDDRGTAELMGRLKQAGYGKLGDWLEELSASHEKRMTNELLTMALSNVILNEFMSRIGDVFDQTDAGSELVRLARNYNIGTLKETIGKLQTIVDDRTIGYSALNSLVSCHANRAADDLMLLPRSQADLLTENQKNTIRRDIEDRIYYSATNDEEEAQWIANFQFYNTPFHLRRRCLPCREAFKSLFQHSLALNKREALDHSIRVFLQMVDHGMIEVSLHPAADKAIEGLVQYIRPTEQALTLLPVRCLLYLPMLSRMESIARAKQVRLREEAEKYLAIAPITDSDVEEDDLLKLADCLEQTKQSACDWNDAYIGSAWYLLAGTEKDGAIDFYIKQHDLVAKYEQNHWRYKFV